MAPATASTALPELRGDRVLLRQATARDAEALTAILTEPEVARWWGQNEITEVREELRTQRSYAIVIAGAVSGWLQVHEETEPTYPSVAFDIALTTRLHGRGYGAEALRLAIAHFAASGHHRFTIDPAADNERAIRCYQSLGFRSVGVLRAYERTPDGEWRDGLLMDLLAGELS